MNTFPNQNVSELSDSRLRAQVRALFGDRRPQQPHACAPPTGLPFELLREIGKGARGTVYLAREHRHKRSVAVKVMQGYADAESRQRFRREGLLASSLNHTNIVPIYKLIRTREIDAIMMEYVPGKTLDRLIPKQGISLDTCLAYALQIAQALAAIHASGMMHRDLKPRNFIITKNGIVKLIDFGLAKFMTSGSEALFKSQPPQTRDGAILGTVGYMSPEQVRGEPADQRSDIFSFGAILYEMLTGHRAFQENAEIATMGAILHKRSLKLPARIPARIARIVRRCLAKDPHRRYKTGIDLAADLDHAVSQIHP